MAVQVTIPSVGESVTSGVIAAWRKNDGDYVQRDDVLLDLETDKITMEVRAEAAGVLKRLAKEGDEVKIGAAVGTIDEKAGAPAVAAAPSQGQAPSKEPPKAQPSGKDTPREAEPARRAAEAAKAGAGPSNAHAGIPPSPTEAQRPETGDKRDGNIRATPLARKTAQDLGVDLSRIVGTGAGQRIREQDVRGFAQSPPSAGDSSGPGARGAGTGEGSGAAGSDGGARGVTRERMSPLRQRVAARLVEAQHTAAMLTTFNECDMSVVIALRTQYKESFEKKHGVGLGFMSFFVKAVVHALRAFPLVNASLVEGEGGHPMIEKHGYCDIAVAVASPKGLVVPVIRGAQDLTMAQIETAVKELATRARDGKLTLEELQGGTFTITNGGVFGSLMSTPILNPPQAAILGMHAIKNRAVEDPQHPGQVVIRPMMYLALSYDHRLIDGSEAVRFLVTIKEAIEDPRRLMLEV